MPVPGEYKTVQARILAYAQEISWTYVPRAEAERVAKIFPLTLTLPEGRAREVIEQQSKNLRARSVPD